MTTLETDTLAQCRQAKQASYFLASTSTETRNEALHSIAASLSSNLDKIVKANAEDLRQAELAKLSPALIDRLSLPPERVKSMVDGIAEIASLPDPLGFSLDQRTLSSGVLLSKISVPIGVIGIIYESRPNVTCDSAALCLKAGNAVILRGGSEALHSNSLLASIMREALAEANLPQDCIQLIAHQEREAVSHLVKANDFVDLIIPRGGEGLINAVVKQATVPVIKHYKGICHIYIDDSASEQMAIGICSNAKCQRPGVCNAVETILIHKDSSERILPALCQELVKQGVELRGDEQVRKIYQMRLATDEDWSTEYLDLVVSIKQVDSLADAIKHINHYGSHHSDAIITETNDRAEEFLRAVDSAAVYHNASTRFTDGSEFGLGAEIGISTDKLHARGPMGLNELTTYKYVIRGDGQTR